MKLVSERYRLLEQNSTSALLNSNGTDFNRAQLFAEVLHYFQLWVYEVPDLYGAYHFK
jgi:hypothetical protein